MIYHDVISSDFSVRWDHQMRRSNSFLAIPKNYPNSLSILRLLMLDITFRIFFLSFFSGSTSRIHVTIWMPTKNEKKPKIHEIPIFSSERAVLRIHLFVENIFKQFFNSKLKLLLCSILLLICKQNLSKSNTFLSAQIK